MDVIRRWGCDFHQSVLRIREKLFEIKVRNSSRHLLNNAQRHYGVDLPNKNTQPTDCVCLMRRWGRDRCRSLIKEIDSSDVMDFYTGQAPDVFAVRVRIGCIGGVHRIVKQSVGNHHAFA